MRTPSTNSCAGGAGRHTPVVGRRSAQDGNVVPVGREPGAEEAQQVRIGRDVRPEVAVYQQHPPRHQHSPVMVAGSYNPAHARFRLRGVGGSRCLLIAVAAAAVARRTRAARVRRPTRPQSAARDYRPQPQWTFFWGTNARAPFTAAQLADIAAPGHIAVIAGSLNHFDLAAQEAPRASLNARNPELRGAVLLQHQALLRPCAAPELPARLRPRDDGAARARRPTGAVPPVGAASGRHRLVRGRELGRLAVVLRPYGPPDHGCRLVRRHRDGQLAPADRRNRSARRRRAEPGPDHRLGLGAARTAARGAVRVPGQARALQRHQPGRPRTDRPRSRAAARS